MKIYDEIFNLYTLAMKSVKTNKWILKTWTSTILTFLCTHLCIEDILPSAHFYSTQCSHIIAIAQCVCVWGCALIYAVRILHGYALIIVSVILK